MPFAFLQRQRSLLPRTSPCLSQFDINEECDVFSPNIKAWVDGKYTTVGPQIYEPKEGP